VSLPAPGELRGYASEFWALGRWLSLTNLTGILTVQAFPWTLAYFAGLEAAAQFQAATNVLGVTHPVIFSMANLIVPAAARARHLEGSGAAWRAGTRFGAQAGVLLVPYFVLLLVWPGPILALFYGPGSPYLGLENVVRLFVVVYSLRSIVYVLNSVLRALEVGSSVFLAQLAGGVAALVVGLPLATRGASTGAAGLAAAVAVEAAATAWLLSRAL
jgi:O-antigen/teichoic acid export membrane protein